MNSCVARSLKGVTTGRDPIFADLPDLKLERVETNVLDSRLVVVEYGPAR